MALTKLNRYSLPTTLDLSAKTLTLPSASVTAHVTQTDLQPIKSDISALALREATNESSAAFNLPNQFIDTFSDDTNLGTQTTVDRISGYVASSYPAVYASTATKLDWFNPTQAGGGTTNYQVKQEDDGGAYDNPTYTDVVESGAIQYVSFAKSQTTNEGNGWSHSGGHVGQIEFYVDVKETKRFSTRLDFSKNNNWGDINQMKMQYSTDGSNWSNVDLSSATQDGATVYGTSSASSGGGLTSSSGTSAGLFSMNANSTSYTALSGFTMLGLPDFDARYIRFVKQSLHSAANNNVGGIYWDMYIKTKSQDAADNATGTLIQSANTVGSAKTKVGGTMLYKDNAGTATLGTDLKIYFTCNGGTNWTEATSYSAITPVYSTGIKQVRLGETTCTSGTDVRYKAVWANQAASSKETQLHGIGVNY